MRGDWWDENAGECPTCHSPALKANYYEFLGGPELIGYFCSSCSMNFANDKTENQISLQGVRAANDRVDLMVEKQETCYKACGHEFGIMGDDGKDAIVGCVRCDYIGIMVLERTKEFPEFWETLGKYIGMPELALICRSIIDEMESEEQTSRKLK